MYVFLAAIFAVGALNRSTVLFVAIAFFAVHMLTGTLLGWSWENRGPEILHMPADSLVGLGLWFWIGAAYWICRDSIPVNGWLAAALAIMIFATFYSPHIKLAGLIVFPYLIYYAAHAPLRVSVPMGDISYGVYLYAWPVTQIVYHYNSGKLSFPAMAALSTALTFGLAWLSWVLVERPALRFKQSASS
jgi:peptidoglycan/LPS O-acetylase OafA/YrhL